MPEFLSYLSTHGKMYNTEEEFMRRYGNFQNSLRHIEQHDHQEKGWGVGLDLFSDWSEEDMSQLYGGQEEETEDMPMVGAAPDYDLTKKLPKELWWTDNTAPVKR